MTTSDPDPTDLEQVYLDAGYPFFMAEALADRGVGIDAIKHMSMHEVMDEVLTWQGIQGYTNAILGAVWFLQQQGKDLR